MKKKKIEAVIIGCTADPDSRERHTFGPGAGARRAALTRIDQATADKAAYVKADYDDGTFLVVVG